MPTQDEARAIRGTTEAERWVERTQIGEEIIEQKKEVFLSSDKAARMFTKDHPHIVTSWRRRIQAAIVADPNARHFPENDTFRALFLKREEAPYAAVMRFSSRQVLVMILRHKGNYLWHHYYECLATFRIARDSTVDAIFDLGSLENVFDAKYKGISQGDSVEAVRKALGEPDGIVGYQPATYFRYLYFQDDKDIYFLNGRVQKMSTGIDGYLRKEVKEKGKHITRF